jgi:two-component system cell cycle sensor histidine kinase/response regulator CckA
MQSPKSKRVRSRVLLLEDNSDDAALCLSELARAGFEIDSEVVVGSQDFTEHLRTHHYDLILADYHLPDWTGIDALRWLRSSGYKTPFILVTGTRGEDLAVECIKSGAADYVLKERLDRLPRACRRAMEEATLRAERDHAERELSDSEEQYRLLFDASPSPMWVFDRDTLAFLAVNEAAVRHYGFSQQEFFAMTIRDIESEELLEAVSHPREGLGTAEVWKHHKKDGTVIDVEITGHTLPFLGRTAVLVLVHDITNQNQNLEKLRQSEERFEKAFRSSPLGVTISAQEDGRYLDVNDAFLEMVGFKRVDVVGRTTNELGIWLEPEERIAMTQQLAESGRVTEFHATFKTNFGDIRLVEVSAELVELDKQTCVLAITKDVTDTKRLEEQFRQAQKMEAVGRLAGGVAHDFNNMLGVIIGYSELLQEQFESGPERKSIDEVKKAAERAAGLTRQLLAFSRQQVLSPAVLDLNVIVDNLGKMLCHMIGEDIQLVLAPGPDLGSVKADPVQVEQIIMNLAVNARDAMPQGGRIVIATSNAELDETYANQQPSIRPGSYVLLAVSDTGSGMSKETMVHIFEPFFTTKETGKGTGLGLSMVYGIVNQSGGCIWVSSDLGNGTTFKIYLPRVDEGASIEHRKEQLPIVRGFETILLVEDEEPLRVLAAGLLESNGYTVLQASGGEAAIRLAKEHGHIDLLITDVVMPGMSGSELASLLRVTSPDFKLLFISGYTGDLISQHGVLENIATLLEKPFTKAALLNKVRIVLKGEPFIVPFL